MNEKYYGLFLKAGIIAVLVIWVGCIVAAAILISVTWVKITVIAIIILVPVAILIVWLFKNISGPQ